MACYLDLRSLSFACVVLFLADGATQNGFPCSPPPHPMATTINATGPERHLIQTPPPSRLVRKGQTS